jgi:NADH-quinone oxidoreductase subunit N
VALGHKFYENHQSKISDFIAIKIFLLAGSSHGFFWKLSDVLLGIGIIYCIIYLAASDRLNLKVMKQDEVFLDGIFASESFFFGICLIYGAMGSFDVIEISDYHNLLSCQFGSQ